MLRAMDSAVAGLRSHQNKMDVVGHNIANVNTFGFKAQTYTFKEAMYQTSTASTAGSRAGGVNAAQYGYGTLMGSIGMDMTASTPSYVGGFNASIDGDGFFITKSQKVGITVGEEADTGEGGIGIESFKSEDFDYTRVGQFLLDSNGYVVDANGNFVYGFRAHTTFEDGEEKVDYGDGLKPLRVPLVTAESATADPTISIMNDETQTGASATTTIEINNAGIISATVKYKIGETATAAEGEEEGEGGGGATTAAAEQYATRVVILGKVAIATFQNPNGVTKSGGSYYKATNVDNTGRAVAAAPGDAGTATLMGGFIEASNVDLAKEFADMITTHRGFQANSKMITVSDEMLSDLVAMKR